MKLIYIFLFLQLQLNSSLKVHSAFNGRTMNRNPNSTTYTIVGNLSGSVTLTCRNFTEQIDDVFWSRNKNKRYQLKKDVIGFKNLTFDDADIYTCKNLTTKSVISNSRLIVQGAPVWAPKPKYYETIWAISDKDVVLPCRFQGFPQASAAWLKNGLTIKTNQVILKGTYDSFDFKIAELNDYDSATYTCRVTNIFGQIARNFSIDVISRLNHAPIITTESVNKTVAIDDEARLYCRAKSDPEQMIRWYKKRPDVRRNGADHAPDLNRTGTEAVTDANVEAAVKPMLDDYFEVFTIEPVTNDLVISNFKNSDSGEYLCLASNPKGSDYRSFWLNSVEPQNSPLAAREVEINAKTDFSNLMILIGIIGAFILVLLLVLFYVLLQRRRLCCVRIKKKKVPTATLH